MSTTRLHPNALPGIPYTFTAKPAAVGDCMTARITATLVAALEEITTDNGYAFNIGRVEQQRYFMDSTREEDFPYAQVCGPWCTPLKQSHNKDLHDLTYIINMRVDIDDADITDDSINETCENYVSEIQRAIMLDVHRNLLAEDTELNDYGYDMESDDNVDWYFITQEITVKALIYSFDPYNTDITLPTPPTIPTTPTDSKKARITDNLIGNLQQITTGNGYDWTAGLVERQRLNPLNLQGSYLPYIEVCGPWPDVVPFTRTKDLHKLNYYIYARFLYSDQDRDDDPITYHFRNRGADLQKAIMADNARGNLAQQTILNEYGYEFSYDNEIMWYFIFQAVQVNVLMDSANPY